MQLITIIIEKSKSNNIIDIIMLSLLTKVID